MTYARGWCAIAEYGGNIYVFGGYPNSNTVEEYNFEDNTWTTKAPMPAGRWAMGAATVGDKIYVIGGSTSTTLSNAYTTVYEYDPNDDKWNTRTSMPTPGRCAYGIGVVNKKIYILGGWTGSTRLDSILEYDPAMDSWSTKESLLSVPRNAFGCATYNNKIYAIGGQTSEGTFNLNEEYQP